MTSYDDSSTAGTSPSVHSTRSLVQLPRTNNNSNYVQRFKVLRDRNKSLPKLDFNAKASGVPKKLQLGVGSFSRSLTYDSMKLPSISASSVVTGVSGKSVHSDGYRRKDNKNSMTDGHSEPCLQEFHTHKDLIDLSNLMSKQQESKETQDEKPNHPQPDEDTNKPTKGHRFESITVKKSLTRRQRLNEKPHKGKTKERSIIAQAEKHLKQTVEKELLVLQGKDARKDNLDSGFADGQERRKDQPLVTPNCTNNNDVTTNSDIITGPSDESTAHATLTTKSPDNSNTVPNNDVTTNSDDTKETRDDVTSPATIAPKSPYNSPPISNHISPVSEHNTNIECKDSPLAQTI